ncbi:helix-turn-helix domain-containing protein [Bradyrhizobium symbiodeficiens]|uniref:helix-turn-helix domain-containing protein n=1 Tax=Bradyrhizobium symbiodeficiens TaxID=1404367 RepID=UPI002FE637AF
MDKAFIKGLRLLETLALSEQPRGVTDLASELKLTKSNVHRLLMTLQSQGYVRQIPHTACMSSRPRSGRWAATSSTGWTSSTSRDRQ